MRHQPALHISNVRMFHLGERVRCFRSFSFFDKLGRERLDILCLVHFAIAFAPVLGDGVEQERRLGQRQRVDILELAQVQLGRSLFVARRHRFRTRGLLVGGRHDCCGRLAGRPEVFRSAKPPLSLSLSFSYDNNDWSVNLVRINKYCLWMSVQLAKKWCFFCNRCRVVEMRSSRRSGGREIRF